MAFLRSMEWLKKREATFLPRPWEFWKQVHQSLLSIESMRLSLLMLIHIDRCKAIQPPCKPQGAVSTQCSLNGDRRSFLRASTTLRIMRFHWQSASHRFLSLLHLQAPIYSWLWYRCYSLRNWLILLWLLWLQQLHSLNVDRSTQTGQSYSEPPLISTRSWAYVWGAHKADWCCTF
jgi:hypothetical protein